jgi:2-haloacid dehalogenase
MAIKALTFDIIGTVFDWYGSFYTRVPTLAHKYGLTLDSAAFALGAEEGYSSGVAAVSSTGKWTPPDQILLASISALLSAQKKPSQQESDDFFNIWRSLNPWPDVTTALYALHNHFSLAILSNMSVVTQTALMGHAGLPFDHTLSAEDVKAYKPNPAVYQMALTKLGLKPDEILMVAAHKYDLDAAKAQGFQTAFVSRPLELGPGGKVDTTPNPAYTFNVTSMAQLAAALNAGAPTLQEDCLPLNPAAIQVKQAGSDWKIVDGSESVLDFGASETNANRAKEIITHYKFDRICFVARPNPPMTYFTVNGGAPVGPIAGEDAIAFALDQVRAELSSVNWIVTDGASILLNFGTNRFAALHAVAIIRNYGFTHQCFVGRPKAPMMYFRK